MCVCENQNRPSTSTHLSKISEYVAPFYVCSFNSATTPEFHYHTHNVVAGPLLRRGDYYYYLATYNKI